MLISLKIPTSPNVSTVFQLLLCGMRKYSVADLKTNHIVNGSSHSFRRVRKIMEFEKNCVCLLMSYWFLFICQCTSAYLIFMCETTCMFSVFLQCLDFLILVAAGFFYQIVLINVFLPSLA